MSDRGPEERGVEAFQEAAGELIAAARAMLDVAEDLVADPRTAQTVVGVIGTIGRAARQADPRSAGDHRPPTGHGGAGDPSASGQNPGDDEVQRIPVS